MLRGPIDARHDAPSRCRSSASRAAICPDRAGRTTWRPARVCGIRLPAGLRESDRLPEPIFTPATKAQSGHDINISEAEAADAGRAGACSTRVKALTLRLYAEGAAHAESLRHHRRRHEVRVRPAAGRRTARHARRSHHPDRRSADARLVALLAAGRLPARRRAAELRQAVRARLPRARSAGTSSRRCRRCPTTSSRRRARNTSRRSAA